MLLVNDIKTMIGSKNRDLRKMFELASEKNEHVKMYDVARESVQGHGVFVDLKDNKGWKW